MARTDKLHLGFILHGVGAGWDDWRHPEAQTDASTNLDFYRRQAELAEAGKFDFLFVADSLSITSRSSPHYLNRFEPITILSALAATTSHIGLVATLTVSYSEPFNVARQLASLDHLSGGRAGWNVVTSWLADTAANFSKTEHPAHDVRYRIAAEYLDVVQGLWDSWEPDALVADKASGVFVDADRLHALDHRGEFFQVRGPLNIKRTPQGQPVIFQAGASEDGKAFAAVRADAIFVSHEHQDAAVAYYAEVKARARSAGRNPDDVKIIPSARPVIGLTDADAEARYQELAGLVHIDNALKAVGRQFNDHDFSVYDLDAPFPVDAVSGPGFDTELSAARRFLAQVKDKGLTLRQAALQLATPRSQFVGRPEVVADALESWFQAYGADGFIIFETLPGQLELFVEHVAPILQARGLYRREYEGATLREHLGVPEPENRYARGRVVQREALRA